MLLSNKQIYILLKGGGYSVFWFRSCFRFSYSLAVPYRPAKEIPKWNNHQKILDTYIRIQVASCATTLKFFLEIVCGCVADLEYS